MQKKKKNSQLPSPFPGSSSPSPCILPSDHKREAFIQKSRKECWLKENLKLMLCGILYALVMCFSSTRQCESNHLNRGTASPTLLLCFLTILVFAACPSLQGGWVFVFTQAANSFASTKAQRNLATNYTVSKYSKFSQTPDKRGQGSSSDSLPNSPPLKQALPREQSREGMLLCLEFLYVNALAFFKITVLCFKYLCQSILCFIKEFFKKKKIGDLSLKHIYLPRSLKNSNNSCLHKAWSKYAFISPGCHS